MVKTAALNFSRHAGIQVPASPFAQLMQQGGAPASGVSPLPGAPQASMMHAFLSTSGGGGVQQWLSGQQQLTGGSQLPMGGPQGTSFALAQAAAGAAGASGAAGVGAAGLMPPTAFAPALSPPGAAPSGVGTPPPPPQFGTAEEAAAAAAVAHSASDAHAVTPGAAHPSLLSFPPRGATPAALTPAPRSDTFPFPRAGQLAPFPAAAAGAGMTSPPLGGLLPVFSGATSVTGGGPSLFPPAPPAVVTDAPAGSAAGGAAIGGPFAGNAERHPLDDHGDKPVRFVYYDKKKQKMGGGASANPPPRYATAPPLLLARVCVSDDPSPPCAITVGVAGGSLKPFLDVARKNCGPDGPHDETAFIKSLVGVIAHDGARALSEDRAFPIDSDLRRFVRGALSFSMPLLNIICLLLLQPLVEPAYQSSFASYRARPAIAGCPLEKMNLTTLGKSLELCREAIPVSYEDTKIVTPTDPTKRARGVKVISTFTATPESYSEVVKIIARSSSVDFLISPPEWSYEDDEDGDGYAFPKRRSHYACFPRQSPRIRSGVCCINVTLGFPAPPTNAQVGARPQGPHPRD